MIGVVSDLSGQIKGHGKSGLPLFQEIFITAVGFFGIGKPVDPEEYVDKATGKRRLMTRNTAALLALGILMMAIWQQQDDYDANPMNIPGWGSTP